MQTKPNRLTWTRIPSPVGDYCDGYQAEGIDGLRIMRHHVDDRAYDGGYVHTYWNLWAHGAALDQYPTLADAKGAAEKLWRAATGKMTDAQEAAIESIDNISTSTVQADGTVEIETDDGWRYFAADGHEIESEREIVL